MKGWKGTILKGEEELGLGEGGYTSPVCYDKVM